MRENVELGADRFTQPAGPSRIYRWIAEADITPRSCGHKAGHEIQVFISLQCASLDVTKSDTLGL